MEEAEGIILVQSLAQFFVITQLVALAFLIAVVLICERTLLWGTTRRLRAFRCPLMKREVEVEFEEGRVLGFRRSVAVKSCAAFELPTAIECRRPCVDSAFRRQWEFALPVHERAESRA